MKKEIAISLKTMGIKARVTNVIRTDIYDKRVEQFSDKQKIEYFNKWFSLTKEAHTELNNYKTKRKYKAKVEKLRLERR